MEWLTKVVSSEGESTEAGGIEGSAGTILGDDSGRLVSFHLRTLPKPRAPGAPGLKKRPSRWCGGKGKFLLWNQTGNSRYTTEAQRHRENQEYRMAGHWEVRRHPHGFEITEETEPTEKTWAASAP